MSEHQEAKPSRTSQVGATAHDAGVATSSNPPARRSAAVETAERSVPGTELCWLELNVDQWEVWTSRDGRKRMLYSSGRDHVKALADLELYEDQERELRQTLEP